MVKNTEMGGKSAKMKKEKKPTDKLADKTALQKFLQGIFVQFVVFLLRLFHYYPCLVGFYEENKVTMIQ